MGLTLSRVVNMLSGFSENTLERGLSFIHLLSIFSQSTVCRGTEPSWSRSLKPRQLAFLVLIDSLPQWNGVSIS